jgi:hypothetical protein
MAGKHSTDGALVLESNIVFAVSMLWQRKRGRNPFPSGSRGAEQPYDLKRSAGQ